MSFNKFLPIKVTAIAVLLTFIPMSLPVGTQGAIAYSDALFGPPPIVKQEFSNLTPRLLAHLGEAKARAELRVNELTGDRITSEVARLTPSKPEPHRSELRTKTDVSKPSHETRGSEPKSEDQIRRLIQSKTLEEFAASLKQLADYETVLRKFAAQLGIYDEQRKRYRTPSKRNRDEFVIEEMVVDLAMQRLGQPGKLSPDSIPAAGVLRSLYLKSLDIARTIETSKHLGTIDPAPRLEEAELIVAYAGWLNQAAWELVQDEKGAGASAEKLRAFHDVEVSKANRKRLGEQFRKFSDAYAKEHYFASAYRSYVTLDYDFVSPVSEDVMVANIRINKRNHMLILFKDAAYDLDEEGRPMGKSERSWERDIRDFRLIPSGTPDAKAADRKLSKAVAAATQRIFAGTEESEEKKDQKGMWDNEAESFQSAAESPDIEDSIEEYFGKRPDHPDFRFPSTTQMALGSPESKVPELEAVHVPQLAEKPVEKEKERFSLHELGIKALFEPIARLMKMDRAGRPRLLTQQEKVEIFKQDAKETFEASDSPERSELPSWIRRIVTALESNDTTFEHVVDKSILSEVVSFPELQADVRGNVLVASAIPRDGKTWVFSLGNEYLYQAASMLTKLLGVDQKMTLIDASLQEIYFEKEDYVRHIIEDAYFKTEIVTGDLSDQDRWLDYHNRFLQRLHYSYKVDPQFRKEIDALRERVLKYLTPTPGESFRFVSESFTTAFAMEFAMRTGEKPMTADPFVIGLDRNMELYKASVVRDDPHYFMNYSPLFKKDSARFVLKFPWFDHTIHKEIYSDKPYGVFGGFQALKHSLRRIFTYNEAVAFLSDAENRKASNPFIQPYKTRQYSLPGGDFTRPEEEEAFSRMLPEQLFQATEEMSEEAWEKHQNSILNRYIDLALNRKFEPYAFLRHIIKMFDLEWSNLFMAHRATHRNATEVTVKTRAILQAVLKAAGSDFLDDKFLLAHYSRNAELSPEGLFLYPDNRPDYIRSQDEEKDRKPEEILQSRGINGLFSYGGRPGPFDSYEESLATLTQHSLRVLALIMEFSPECVGPGMMRFLVAMADAAMDRYGIMIHDSYGWNEGAYGIASIFNIPFVAFRHHPDYFAKLLLESPHTPGVIKFLLDPQTEYRDSRLAQDLATFEDMEYGTRDEESGSVLADEVLEEMVRQNSLDGKQLEILREVAQQTSNIVSETILGEWRKIGVNLLNDLFNLRPVVTAQNLEQMDAVLKQHGFRHRSVALFLVLHPTFDVQVAKELDSLFEDESAQVILKFMAAVESKSWSLEEVRRLYQTTMWGRASAGTHHQYVRDVLMLKPADKEKLFVMLSGNGKELKPQRMFDLYLLNIPRDHPLYDKYKFESAQRDMSYSSFVEGENAYTPRETEGHVLGRVSHRARLLLKDLDAILKLPEEELARRVGALKEFETKSAELDNTTYRLFLVIPNEHFDELFRILKDNFEGLKNLRPAKAEITKLLQQLVAFNPELKNASQKEVVRWAAEQLGINSLRRLTSPDSTEEVRNRFRERLKTDNLGVKVTARQANDEERRLFRTVVAVHRLLLTIVKNIKLFKPWLGSIPEAETDSRYMLPVVTTHRSELRNKWKQPRYGDPDYWPGGLDIHEKDLANLGLNLKFNTPYAERQERQRRLKEAKSTKEDAVGELLRSILGRSRGPGRGERKPSKLSSVFARFESASFEVIDILYRRISSPRRTHKEIAAYHQTLNDFLQATKKESKRGQIEFLHELSDLIQKFNREQIDFYDERRLVRGKYEPSTSQKRWLARSEEAYGDILDMLPHYGGSVSDSTFIASGALPPDMPYPPEAPCLVALGSLIVTLKSIHDLLPENAPGKMGIWKEEIAQVFKRPEIKFFLAHRKFVEAINKYSSPYLFASRDALQLHLRHDRELERALNQLREAGELEPLQKEYAELAGRFGDLWKPKDKKHAFLRQFPDGKMKMPLAEIDFHARVALMMLQDGWELPDIEQEPGTIKLDSYSNPLIGETEDDDSLDTFENMMKRLHRQDEVKIVPVTIDLGGEKSALLLTGPNMGGKTTTVRGAGVAVLLTQIGFPVPAKNPKISPFRNIYTVFPRPEQLEAGYGYFESLLKDLVEIGKKAGRGDLVVLDEVPIGTDYNELVPIAVVLIEDLIKSGATVLVTGHLKKAMELIAERTGMQPWMHTMTERNGEMEPDFNLVPGIAKHSYAIALMKKAGFPKSVMERAKAYYRYITEGVPMPAPEQAKTDQTEKESVSIPKTKERHYEKGLIKTILANLYPEEFFALERTRENLFKELAGEFESQPFTKVTEERLERTGFFAAQTHSFLMELSAAIRAIEAAVKVRGADLFGNEANKLANEIKNMELFKKAVQNFLRKFSELKGDAWADKEIAFFEEAIAALPALRERHEKMLAEMVTNPKGKVGEKTKVDEKASLDLTMDYGTWAEKLFEKLDDIDLYVALARGVQRFPADLKPPHFTEEPRVFWLKNSRPFYPNRSLFGSPTGEPFIKNAVLQSITISPEKPVFALTGPNSSGKTALMFNCRMNALFASHGLYVSGDLEMSGFNPIFAFFGSHDEIASGQSYFLSILSEYARIVRDATKNSFVILDELHGTDYFELAAIQLAVLYYLKSIGATVIFNTHVRDGLKLLAQEGVDLWKTDVDFDEKENKVKSHYTISPDPNLESKSYGLQIAKKWLTEGQFRRAMEIHEKLTHEHRAELRNVSSQKEAAFNELAANMIPKESRTKLTQLITEATQATQIVSRAELRRMISGTLGLKETDNPKSLVGLAVSRFTVIDPENPEPAAQALALAATVLDNPIAFIGPDELGRTVCQAVNSKLPLNKQIILAKDWNHARSELRKRGATSVRAIISESESATKSLLLREYVDDVITVRQGQFAEFLSAAGVAKSLVDSFRSELRLTYSA